MKPIRTTERMPECYDDFAEEVWWYNQEDNSWTIGIPMLMGFDVNPDAYYKWTYWLPKECIPLPEDVEYEEDEQGCSQNNY